MINFLHTFQPQPILANFGVIKIYWYGLFLTVAMIAGIWLFYRLASSRHISLDTVLDYAFWLIVSALVGARLYHIGLEWQYYLEKPQEIIQVWHGGLAIHGAILFGTVAAWIFTHKRQLDFWLMAAWTVPALALGQAIGRWGNYFNSELYGTATALPWGIPINLGTTTAGDWQYFHPVFLYESILSLTLCLLLLLLHRRKVGARAIVGAYALGYGLIRFSMEFLRSDIVWTFGGLRWPQWASILLAVIGVILIAKNAARKSHDI